MTETGLGPSLLGYNCHFQSKGSSSQARKTPSSKHKLYIVPVILGTIVGSGKNQYEYQVTGPGSYLETKAAV